MTLPFKRSFESKRAESSFDDQGFVYGENASFKKEEEGKIEQIQE